MTKPSKNIINSIAGADLHITELIDPKRLDFYTQSIASQYNKFRMKYAPQKRCIDLHNWITDIIIETTAQGASLLEVHVIDPAWTLLRSDANGASFIDVDEDGFLWPPVEVTFPKENSDATWRLCQCRPSTSLTEANLILTFEDKIVSELREHFGQQVSYPNQTRAEFIQDLVKQANASPTLPGEVDIRFVHLLPQETFTVADLSMSQRLPASATQNNPPPARKHPNKGPKPLPITGANSPRGHDFPAPTDPVTQSIQGIEISIQTGMDAFLGSLTGKPFSPNPFPSQYGPQGQPKSSTGKALP